MIQQRYQTGMTAIGWLIVLAFIGSVVLVALKLTPLYLEYMSIARCVTGTAEKVRNHEVNPDDDAKVRDVLRRHFEVNQLDDKATIKPEDVKIKKENGKMTISAKYEARTPLVANIDLVAKFDKTVEAPLK